MNNNEIKPIFEETIRAILNGVWDKEIYLKLANALKNYTWSYSKLKPLLKNKKQFLHSLVKPFEETEATLLGKIVHELYLDGCIDSKYVFEKVSGRTKAGKERNVEIESQGKIKVNPELLIIAENCNLALRSDERTDLIFEKTESWETLDIYGFKIGGYVDAQLDDSVYELKTSGDAEPDKFTKSAVDFGYALQAYIYKEITGKNNIFYPVVETKPPYTVSVFKAGPEYVIHGKTQFEVCINELSELIYQLESGSLFLNYETAVLKVPKWESAKLGDKLKKQLLNK
jgi:hypothetical protein